MTAVVLEPGGFCSSVGGLVGVESGFDAAVWRADGSQVAAGRPPLAEDLAWDSSGESIAVLGQNGWVVVTSTGQRLDLGPASSLAWHPTERSLAIARDGRLSVLGY